MGDRFAKPRFIRQCSACPDRERLLQRRSITATLRLLLNAVKRRELAKSLERCLASEAALQGLGPEIEELVGAADMGWFGWDQCDLWD